MPSVKPMTRFAPLRATATRKAWPPTGTARTRHQGTRHGRELQPLPQTARSLLNLATSTDGCRSTAVTQARPRNPARIRRIPTGVYSHKDNFVKPKELILQRLDEIHVECKRFLGQHHASGLSDKQWSYVNKLAAETKDLEDQLALHKKATSMASYASPNEYDGSMNPGGYYDGTAAGAPGIAFKGIGPGMERQIRPTSLYQMDKSQINALKQAAQQGTPFKVQLGSKGIEHGYFGGVRDKSAITEGGLTPNLLPPIQQVGDRGWYSLPYELTRVANFLPNVAMDGPGIAYFSHTANAVEAGYTAEAGTKPDITPTVTENYIRPAKVAGRVNLSHELTFRTNF